MSLSLSLDVVDALRAIARSVANMTYNIPVSGNYFRTDALNANLPGYEIGESLKCFCTGVHSTITFSEIQPIRIISIDVDPPMRFNEHDAEVVLATWNNGSDEPITRKVKSKQELVVTQSKDILTEISSAIRAKVGGKTPVFEASMEAEVAAKLGMNLKEQLERTTLKEEEEDIRIPAWTSTSILQKHSIADVKQVVRMRCLIDAQVALVSDGEGGRWSKHFSGMRELENYFRGGGGGTDENTEAINAFVNTRAFENFRVETEYLELSIEEEHISRNTETFEVTRRDVPIENPNRRKRGRRRNKGGRK